MRNRPRARKTAETHTSTRRASGAYPARSPVIPNSASYSLDRLIADITDENRHGEIDFGRPIGKETF